MPFTVGLAACLASYPHYSLESFNAVLDAGLDGFHLEVQPSLDVICVITANSVVRKTKYASLPLFEDGQPTLRLSDALELATKVVIAISLFTDIVGLS
jgi:glycerophosphoryl diester phosphodiesterase